MKNKIPVGEYGYAVDGDAYLVASHVPAGYIAYPVYEDSDGMGDYADEKHPVTIDKLFTSPPVEKYSDEIKRLQDVVAGLKQQEQDQKKALAAIRNEIAQAERTRKEVALEFPFLETALKVKKGELPYYVRGDGYACMQVRRVESGWGNSYPEKLTVAHLSIDRRGSKTIEFDFPLQFFATEEAAKEYARQETLKALLNYDSLKAQEPLEYFIKRAKEQGIDVPNSVMIRQLEKERRGALTSAENYSGWVCREEAKAAELQAQIEALQEGDAP